MKKTNLTIGALLLGSVLFVSNFVACSGGEDGTGQAGTTGAAGTVGNAGTNGGGAGTSGPTDGGAGTTTGPTDGGPSATLADGKCVTGAFKRDGVCQCQGSVPNVCGDMCTDVKTDNDNCGSCGMKCAGSSTCNNGTCGPAAVAVLPKVTGCGELTIALNAAGDKIFYANKTAGAISSVPTAGGAATPVTGAATEKAPTAITVSGTNVLWINNVPGAGMSVASTIRKSANGAAPVDLVTATADGGGIRGMAVSADGNTVYYSTGNYVKAIPMAGGTSTDIALEEHGGIPGAIAIDGTKLVYPTDLNGDVDVITIVAGTVAKCGKPNAQNPEIYDMVNCVRIARSQGSLRKDAMLAFGGWAYWIDGGAIKGGELAPAGTAANDQIGSTMLNPITSMAVNPAKTNIYFTESDVNAPTGMSGIVQKTGKAKESPQSPLARNQVAPYSIAVTATKVYWAADCGIWSTNP
jgi:hypothetical protein